MLKKLSVLFLVAILLFGCAPSKHGQDASTQSPVPQIAPPAVDSVEKRQMQTRIFDTPDEKMLLSASATALQGLGFTLKEDHPDLGFLTGTESKMSQSSKNAVGAMVAAEVLKNFGPFGALAAVSLAIGSRATGIAGGETTRALLVITPVGDGRRLMVRLTLLQVLTNGDGTIAMANVLATPKDYQEFFDKLAQATTLEAHAL